MKATGGFLIEVFPILMALWLGGDGHPVGMVFAFAIFGVQQEWFTVEAKS